MFVEMRLKSIVEVDFFIFLPSVTDSVEFVCAEFHCKYPLSTGV